MIKKRKNIFMIIITAIIFVVIYIICTLPRNISVSYKGYFVNDKTKEITEMCDIKIEGKYKKVGHIDTENWNVLGKFSGFICIGDEKYEIKGSSIINDDNKHSKDDEGNDILYLSILKDGEPIYITHSSDNFNNEKLYFITPTTFNTTTQKYDPYSIKLVATTNTIENSSEILDNLPDPNK